jgi:hypothetical protein
MLEGTALTEQYDFKRVTFVDINFSIKHIQRYIYIYYMVANRWLISLEYLLNLSIAKLKFLLVKGQVCNFRKNRYISIIKTIE